MHDKSQDVSFNAVWLYLGSGSSLDGLRGGDSTPTNTNTNTNTNLRSGILKDAPVGGVSYSTTSGKTGTTDASGTYQFNAGDSVTFTLGGLTLGTAPATGIVTPTELAGGDNNKLLNLLVILQSLDSDGDRTNGITIPPAAASALTAIDLTVVPASLNTTALQAAMAAGNITSQVVSTTDAQAHYIAQGMSSLGSNIWIGKNSAGVPETLVRFGASGQYVIGRTKGGTGGETPGVEYGTATIPSFDANGYRLAATISVDTDGNAGLSHPLACDRVRSTGDELISTSGTANTDGSCTVTETGKLVKADNDPTGIVGVWAESPTGLQDAHLALFANGRFLFVSGNPVAACETAGIESGTYSYNPTSKAFKIETVDVDTNGCDGMADAGAAGDTPPVTVNADGTATITDPVDGPITLYRVSK